MDSAVGIISLAVTTLVSLGLFVWQLIAGQQRDRRSAHEQAIDQVIDALTVVVRRLDRPAFLRPWFKPELEFALVIPRFTLRLAKADAVVGKWAMQQVQLTQRAKSDREAAHIGLAMTNALTEWHTGSRSRSWFAERIDPALAAVPEVPVHARFRRQISRMSEQVGAALGLVIAGLTVALGAGLGFRFSDTPR
jgi:hypothetical protein